MRVDDTQTSASWLNQFEGVFGILTKQSLSVTDVPSTRALMDHLRAYLRALSHNPTPFDWTTPARAIIKSRQRMLDRISTAAHWRRSARRISRNAASVCGEGLAPSSSRRRSRHRLIAASARELGAVVVTENARDFAVISSVVDLTYREPWPAEDAH